MKGFCEIRGIVNKDGTMSYGECTQYDPDFGKFPSKALFLYSYLLFFEKADLFVDLPTFENMLEYYHGMCKDLCVK